MNYLEVEFTLRPLLPAREVLVAELADRGFDSFDETDEGVKAYIPVDSWNDETLEDLMTEGIEEQEISWTIKVIEATNWNAEWEKNFEPIIVDGRCLIRAPFHEEGEAFDYVITIEPKMSFGTGHHSTTHLMISEMLQTNFADQTVLDMGSGTGVLAILAEKLGATDIDAIDIDEWAFENAEENKMRNGATRITCYQGGAELLGKKVYDTILANINRNILLRDMHAYAAVLKSGGMILFSGFYSQDIPYLLEEGAKHGLTEVGRRELNEWNLLSMKKAGS
jgi:ribosomal protein L11 methyltransferase